MSKYEDKNYFRYKSIRDPLYGFIDLSKKEIEVIDSPSFRRLQNIKQLSHAFVVYPSAIHTRFEHSLGAVHIASRMCDQLDILGEQKELVRQSMLLHDIGHGPFSHLFEYVLKDINGSNIDHEDITSWIINEDPDIKSIIGNNRKKIIKILKKEDHAKDWETGGYSLNSDIVSSGLDADKLDYLRRDSYHIGAAYGQFDLERIILTLKKTPTKNRICIDQKGKDAIENYRLGRYLMHAQVYEHHARISADQMFLKALKFAVEDNVIDKKSLKASANSSNKKFLDYYLKLDDRGIYQIILNKKNSRSAKILDAINCRKLLKRACEYELVPMEDYEVNSKILKLDPEKLTDELASQTKINHADIIVKVSKITIKLYDKGDILVLHKGIPVDFNDLSPISSENSITKLLVFGPRDNDKREKLTKAIANYLKIPAKEIRV